MTVLIVDDDEANLFIMAAVVRRVDGAEPVTVAGPAEALDWLRNNEPDLILLDQMMPDMDGMELLRHIREDRRLNEVPVVMITANTSVEVRVRALDEGCNDFLTKPIVVPEVQARMRNLLALRQSRSLLRDRAALLAAEVDRVTAALQRQGQELVHRLSRAAECRDPETGAHIERMARYSEVIAEAAGFDRDYSRQLRHAAPMHDIGKVGIPDLILLKPGRLSPEELLIMRQHTQIGHRILADSAVPLLQLAAEIALSHHEKFDGSGYPHGLAGNRIPASGRIVAVADVFDALTNARPYKRAWSLTDARDFMLANRGSHFDPDFMDAFLTRWDVIRDIHHTLPDIEEVMTPDD
ncbi:HD domain-containing phosphohydrolase [Azospirillum thermophilum]|uniref:Two-component system response regulator n=1 Tax=Azospirillum thermophilum TaxID=2202148 RepID=A0A2S2CMT3_9PROT|nr:HD domain-containing phosphohydrolase [Azospirillum thermophilum]AWK85749.1 two-component system response regulator [Azospirillum thermophilum]